MTNVNVWKICMPPCGMVPEWFLGHFKAFQRFISGRLKRRECLRSLDSPLAEWVGPPHKDLNKKPSTVTGVFDPQKGGFFLKMESPVCGAGRHVWCQLSSGGSRTVLRAGMCTDCFNIARGRGSQPARPAFHGGRKCGTLFILCFVFLSSISKFGSFPESASPI